MSIRMSDLPEHVRARMAAQAPPVKLAPAHVPGRMNKTEARLAAALEVRKAGGEFVQVGFEALTFRLGFDCRFTPDFACWTPDGRVVCFECKGRKGKSYYAKDDAIVKLRAAAAMYPMVTFIIVWPVNDEWGSKEVQP